MSPSARAYWKSPAVWWLAVLGFVALGRDFLANGRPLYCQIDGQTYFPGLRSIWEDPAHSYGVVVLDSMVFNPILWKTYPYESAVFAPIPFSPGEWFSKPECKLAGPGTLHQGMPARFVHWLGTDRQGRDIAAGMVSGARIALMTGALAMFMAFGIGMLLGGIAGYFGDTGFRLAKPMFWCALIGTTTALMYTLALGAVAPARGSPILQRLAPILLLLAFLGLGAMLSKKYPKKMSLPADLFIMRLAEIFNAIPRLILIVALAAISPSQSTLVMIALIGVFSWTGPALFIRSELLKVRSMDYIQAVRGLGIPEARILWRHALPNALQPVLVAFALGVGSAIILEASLSFLGFGGMEFGGLSWGNLLNNIVDAPRAWWIAIPPGLAIGCTVWALNSLADKRSGRQ
ncbi:MAG: ABC transporter permease [Lewinellaceae bacterium]|nr:ABC transporter permease [Lewinellaceae bacterium]